MTKVLIAALAFAGAVWLTGPADAAPRGTDGLTNATVIEMSAHKRRHRHAHRHVHRHSHRYVVRHYDPPRYYGYYGPTYYARPYRRPAPLWFGVGGYW